jgi:hypothetical protein
MLFAGGAGDGRVTFTRAVCTGTRRRRVGCGNNIAASSLSVVADVTPGAEVRNGVRLKFGDEVG